ncbi:MAG: septum site-determining protein MinC [Gammaproteobacteria bacterium]|nr:septum site-determining protein MinC [Gammaproteobacteria bacterium]
MDKPCFELKGSLFTLSVLQLFENDLSLLEKQLKERIKTAPGFFNYTPFVIDLHEFKGDTQDLNFVGLKKLLLSLSIIPIGVKGAEKSQHSLLEKAGMAILAESNSKKTSEIKAEEAEEDIISPPESVDTTIEQESHIEQRQSQENETQQNTTLTQEPTKIVKQTVRSGQQIYATKGDLVVIGSISTGAEILASGNIHIYGTLRGRALAGIHGDQSASIFCHSLQAELYSIAGVYLLSDDIPVNKIGMSVHIYLKDDKLQIESI